MKTHGYDSNQLFLIENKSYPIINLLNNLNTIYINSEYQKDHHMSSDVVHIYFLTDKELRTLKLKQIGSTKNS